MDINLIFAGCLIGFILGMGITVLVLLPWLATYKIVKRDDNDE